MQRTDLRGLASLTETNTNRDASCVVPIVRHCQRQQVEMLFIGSSRKDCNACIQLRVRQQRVSPASHYIGGCDAVALRHAFQNAKPGPICIANVIDQYTAEASCLTIFLNICL